MRLSYNAREPVEAHYPKSLQRKRLRTGEQGRGVLSRISAINSQGVSARF